MLQYTLKRILTMIPTFFVVSLIIFLVLNMAPGRPGRAGQQGMKQTSESAGQNEAYRIFKEQFNLDKPILVNTRFTLDRGDVEVLIKTVVDYQFKELPDDQRPAIGDVIESRDTIEDWGQYAVPALYEIASDESADKDVRWFATQQLSANAKRRLINEFSSEQQSKATRQLNREIDQENTVINEWKYARNDPDAKRAATLKNWEGWFAEKKARFEYNFSDKVGIFFLDTRFAKYWGNLIRLDLGVSNLDRRPILTKILEKLRYSITLSFGSILLVYLISVPLGVFSAVRKDTPIDKVLTVILFMLYSLPTFFVGLLLLKLLSVGPDYTLWPQMPSQEALAVTGAVVEASSLNIGRAVVVLVTLAVAVYTFASMARKSDDINVWSIAMRGVGVLLVFWLTSLVVQVSLFGSVSIFPTGGFESVEAARDMTTIGRMVDIGYHLVLPMVCLTYGGLAVISRYARSGLLDVIQADYIRTARAKGLSEPVVIIKHAVRNGMIPILTLLGGLLPALIGGSVVIEIIYNIPGLGLFLFESITLRDYNAVMGVLLISSILTLIGLLISDLSYALVDPRISFK